MSHTPASVPLVLARYKFVARLATQGRRVLELGCGEGVGGLLLAESAAHYTGVDSDPRAIRCAQKEIRAGNILFAASAPGMKKYGEYDAVVVMDVRSDELLHNGSLLAIVSANLQGRGVAVLGFRRDVWRRYGWRRLEALVRGRLARAFQCVLVFTLHRDHGAVAGGVDEDGDFVVAFCCGMRPGEHGARGRT
ncbi:MAG: methyltransferase domain-containing protein [Phycisphaerae bacterium]|nr:methyltransferase domain-containing protein [Phycisphaerae bacterium]